MENVDTENGVLPKALVKALKDERKTLAGEVKGIKKLVKERRLDARRTERTGSLFGNRNEILTEANDNEEEDLAKWRRIQEIDEQLARHSAMEGELKKLKANIREVEKQKDEMIAAARAKISEVDAKRLILERFQRLLTEQFDGYLRQYQRAFIAAVENLWQKYAVTTKQILGERDQAAAQLSTFTRNWDMSDRTDRPEGWASVRLGDHTTVKARLGWKGLKAEEYVEDGYIFLATPNLKANRIDFENVNYISKWRYDESPEIQLRIGDVLIVKDGSTLGISNYVRYLPRPTTVNSSIAVVRTESTLFPEFLYHFVNGDEFQGLITLKKAGLGVPHLFQADLREFAVSLPPLPEQRKIARILRTLDNLIEKTQALIAKYEAIKQGMMHDLFTRGVDAHDHLRP